MEKEYELQHTIIGPEERLINDVRVLNRTVHWTEDGTQYERGRRRADAIVSQLGMEGTKPLSSPGITHIECTRKEDEDKGASKNNDSRERNDEVIGNRTIR